MAHDVFISYASHDNAVADAACAILEDRGIRCWIVPRDTPECRGNGGVAQAVSSTRLLFTFT